MEVGENYTVEVTGKVMKKELYKDGQIRVWIENVESNEMAIVKERSKVDGTDTKG
jgi:hypothetical protein